MPQPIIVALDTDTDTQALTVVDALSDLVDVYKIGPVLFYRYGTAIIRGVIERGKRVFLDVKLYDIPNTVSKAVESIRALGIFSVSVHLSGGREMLRRAAVQADRPQIWGVSVLTSFDAPAMNELGVRASVRAQVARLARIGMECDIDGIVASAHELKALGALRRRLNKNISLIVPGIRPERDDRVSQDDQKRTMTARDAMRLGADYLVIGRPIIAASDPRAVVTRLYEEIAV